MPPPWTLLLRSDRNSRRSTRPDRCPSLLVTCWSVLTHLLASCLPRRSTLYLFRTVATGPPSLREVRSINDPLVSNVALTWLSTSPKALTRRLSLLPPLAAPNSWPRSPLWTRPNRNRMRRKGTNTSAEQSRLTKKTNIESYNIRKVDKSSKRLRTPILQSPRDTTTMTKPFLPLGQHSVVFSTLRHMKEIDDTLPDLRSRPRRLVERHPPNALCIMVLSLTLNKTLPVLGSSLLHPCRTARQSRLLILLCL